MKSAHAVALALALPGVHEEPHFEAQSFRVGRKIFATLPPGDAHLHVLVGAEEAAAARGLDPRAFEELWWGKQLAGVRVVLAHADPDAVGRLLEQAWRRRATKAQIAELEAGRRT